MASGPTVPRTLCELHSRIFCSRRRSAIVFIVSPPLCCVMTWRQILCGTSLALCASETSDLKWSVISHHSRDEGFAQAAGDQGSSDWPWLMIVESDRPRSSTVCVHYRDDLFYKVRRVWCEVVRVDTRYHTQQLFPNPGLVLVLTQKNHISNWMLVIGRCVHPQKMLT